jgi:hypothetical protein
MNREREPEIGWSFAERIPPGIYPAYCRAASLYWDKHFKRWVCAVQFDVLDGSLINTLGTVTWYLNLGSRTNPRAGRRTNYWRAWVGANGGPPKRRDRLSPRVFVRRQAIVRVADTTKTHLEGYVRPSESYSVIREVVEWQTGGPANRTVGERAPGSFGSNNHSNQPIKAGTGGMLPRQ